MGADGLWRTLLADSITTVDALIDRFTHLESERTQLERVVQRYPLRINPYVCALIDQAGDPMRRQAVPDVRECAPDPVAMADPLAEERDSPVANLTHRYPDRALLLVANECPMYCRFCTRKRKVGHPFAVDAATIDTAIAYVAAHPEIRDVLVSGGDPLLLEDDHLEDLLVRLRRIAHVEVIRLGTRAPCTLPQRVTEPLARLLGRLQPLYVVTHFNHPAELTDAAARACGLLANAGVPLASQTVLLRQVNDCPSVMRDLLRGLVRLRVRPYYLHQCDLTRGAGHFRTSIASGIEIIKQLRGRVSGLAIPHYVVDLPGGGGKVPLCPDYVHARQDGMVYLRGAQGGVHAYPLDPAGLDKSGRV